MHRGLKRGILGLSVIFFIIFALSACSLINNDKVAFSPSSKCENLIIKQINNSKYTIDVVVYAINNNNIVNALKKAHQKGVTVRILTDKLQASHKSSKVIDLYNAGLNIRVHSKHKIEHNKFAIFDKNTVLTGSYNWTNAATSRNSENCYLIVENKDIVEEYNSRFSYLWQINTKKKSEQWFKKKMESKQYNDGKIISAEQQKDIQNTLEKSIDRYSAKGGAVIVMDADNSQILSMTSVYNGNNLFNYVTDYLYEAGPVYQPFTIAAGLEYKIINDDSKFDVSQPLKIYHSKVLDFKQTENPYELPLNEVLAQDSNISISKIALKIGGNQLKSFFTKLNLTEPMSLGIIDVKTPVFPKKLYKKTSSRVASGHFFWSTPLHLVSAYASLVNGGIYNAPVLEKNTTEKGKYIISAENSQKMQKYLRKVVVNGSAKLANVKNIEFMAKTGSAYKMFAVSNNEYSIITNIVGNFKYKNTHYVIYVLLDEPQPTKETYGFVSAAWNAAPTAKEIINIIIEENK